MGKYLQVFTTVDDREKAELIADRLVEKRLAACVQITGPITSVYRWKGKKERSKEWLLIIKSDENHYLLLEEEIRSLHSYEIPEIVASPIVFGNRSYLAWIDDNLMGTNDGAEKDKF